MNSSHHPTDSPRGTPPAAPPSASPSGRHRRRWLPWVVGLLVALIALQLGGSLLATHLVNRQLSQLHRYTGRVESLWLVPWRGGIALHDFSFRSRGTEGDPPIVLARRAFLTLSPSALFHGRLGGRASVEDLQLNFVKRERYSGIGEATEQAGEKLEVKKEEAAHWQDVLRGAVPMELTELEVVRGQIRFIDPTHEPVVNVGAERFHLIATGLRNRSDGEQLPAHVRLTGETTGGGSFDLQMRADPIAEPLRFESTFQLRGLNLPSFNHFMLAYTGMDVSRGTFDLDLQVQAAGGTYEGFTKPFFRDLDFENPSDKDKPLLRRAAESVVDATAKLLKNEESGKVATATPFSGTFEEAEADVRTSAANLLRNAFVEAIREGIRSEEPTR